MSFYDVLKKYDSFNIEQFCSDVTNDKIKSILAKDQINELEYLSLLSDAADGFIEQIAQKAKFLTCNYFGKAVKIFTPLYISNFCENVCAYCSFARQHDIERRHLSLDEVRVEAEHISRTGIRHILVLTGESDSKAPIEYICGAVSILREYFSSVAIEIYPLSRDGYQQVVAAGADSLTVFQETYNISLYEKLHCGGPKGDFCFRLDTPERGCEQGMRAVTIGALFGLHDWKNEAFFAGIHAAYLQKKFPSVEVSVSFPRLRPQAGEYISEHIVSDRTYVRMMIALRLFLHSVGITVSTRESVAFRDAILPMGVTKMSAGVSTAVGGHTGKISTSQFEIADSRDVDEVKTDLLRMGYQPVMHDWSNRLDA
jgi:2-iminoacetate synthase